MAFGLWRANTSYSTKRSALLAHVVGPLLSAAETVLYTSSEWKKFDRTICMYARRALNGRATTKTANPDGTIKYRSWTNERVRKFWRLPTAQTEAIVRRLKWAQELSVRPLVNCQALAAMLGDVPFEGTRASPAGRIIRPIGPWAQRLIDDIKSMADTIDGAEDFLREVDSRWLLLFCDSPEADRFQRYDMAEIRAREYSAAIPPPGASSYWDEQKEEHDLPEKNWICDMIDEANPGMTCGAEFASHRALLMHRRRAHNWGPFLSRRVCVNVCTNCSSVFSSRATAIDHLIRAYTKGYCPRGRSIHTRINHSPNSTDTLEHTTF